MKCSAWNVVQKITQMSTGNEYNITIASWWIFVLKTEISGFRKIKFYHGDNHWMVV